MNPSQPEEESATTATHLSSLLCEVQTIIATHLSSLRNCIAITTNQVAHRHRHRIPQPRRPAATAATGLTTAATTASLSSPSSPPLSSLLLAA
ncbi:hypothetical protein HN51_032994, partial [Arachis hypogaea]